MVLVLVLIPLQHAQYSREKTRPEPSTPSTRVENYRQHRAYPGRDERGVYERVACLTATKV